jgi:hypothetical protein
MALAPILLEKMSVFAAKVETTAGTAEALTAAEGAYNVYDLDISPNFNMRERPEQGGFSRRPSVPEGITGRATFKMDLISGSATPAWAGVLLAACGIGVDTGVYKLTALPIGAVGATQKTVTLGQYEHGRLKLLYGAMGNVKFTFTSAKVVVLDFTFDGIFQAVTDATQIAPTYPTTAPLFFVDQDFTIGSFVPQVSVLTLDIGNRVYLRPGVSATGYVHACITDQFPKLTLDPEASLVADADLFGDLRAMTEAAATWKAAGGTADTATFAATKCQFTQIRRANREGVLVDALEAQLNAHDLGITFATGA